MPRLPGTPFIPIYPFVLLGLAVGVERLWEKKIASAKITVGIFLAGGS